MGGQDTERQHGGKERVDREAEGKMCFGLVQQAEELHMQGHGQIVTDHDVEKDLCIYQRSVELDWERFPIGLISV